ncbi:TRAP transporter large permease [Aquibaculum arenosum]|uniref:TRAP transporter large permease protein n=1 Tax=Aquibaculum arenosum TaxID=3032591 RepID=A0ABT5YMY0_9PROT|nr:TRAP transporter large permease [Fodinicurvata sp. CAU 1616]MDF2095619.1 TRAP transporter large permease [Fodinicurvata sp. CAU 1616]
MFEANLALLLVFAALMLIGTPIAVALGVGGAVGILLGLDVFALGTLGTNTYNGIAKYPLIAIPLFILTGMIFERSGVAGRLVGFAQACIGPRRGGLALVAILVCLIMGGMSGSGPADAAAVATVMIPSMLRAGYPKPFSASVIAASASTAIVIPPSIALIVYAVMVPGTDLRALFAAGVIPGLLVGLAVAIPTVMLSRRNNFGEAEVAERPPFWPSLWDALPGLMAPVIILGGLRSGLFTPTETAVVAVFYGLLVGTVLYRTMGWRDIYRVLVESAKISAVLMLIVSLAGIFAWAGSTMGAFRLAAEALLTVSDSQWIILLLVMGLLLLAGMVLDGVSIYLITLPLLIPIVTAFEWSFVWFGILMAMNIAIGQFTPPVAVNLMVTAKVASVPIESTFRWVGWILLSMITALGLIIAFPEIALWLPRVLGYRIT